jgi:hypothetical protein
MRTARVLVAVPILLTAAVGCSPGANQQPTCRSEPPTVLMAESVPSATLIPCVDALPQGWSWHGFEANDAGATFSLDQQDGDGLLEVQLVPSCQVSGPGEQVEGFPTAERHRTVDDGGATVVWTSTFPGGCSNARLTFSSPPAQSEVDRIERAISFFPRDQLQPT